MSIRESVTLDDKYETLKGKIYLSGLQVMARIPMMQRELDIAAKRNTAAFISGYRGSPLGGVDQTLWRAKKYLDKYNIHFWSGINEDLGATAVWGSQQLGLGPQAKYDGVIGLWYGKGPGIDRSLDAIKHANAAGSSRFGGVLAYAGDDHACKSSTMPHQSEYAFSHALMPVMNPSGIQDALDLGMHGIAMSRYSGLWVGFKILSELADSSASVYTNPFALNFNMPTDFNMPEKGLNIRWYDAPVEQEERLYNLKIPAAQAYARANKLDKAIFGTKNPRITIITTGKAYMDLRQALSDLGITKERAIKLGIEIYKIAMVWPLEPEGIKNIALNSNELFAVEEKRGIIEEQCKDILYNIPATNRPLITGKSNEDNSYLLPSNYELNPLQIAEALVKRLKSHDITEDFQNRLDKMKSYFGIGNSPSPVIRKPWYCAGCPHNTSTKVPEGSRAMAGIGCHYMTMWMDRNTTLFTQMGGEGVPWIGQSPFTDEKHIFSNLGDGTYFHSGLLAIRACVSANVNITYKILYNDAVAMTGGQHVDGPFNVGMLARQVEAEGVKDIYIVTDEPDKYPKDANFPPMVKIRHRDELDKVQKTLREVKGVSILIYDQTCAAEKRRRRKRGQMDDPPRRIFINEAVCEACGDCGKASNCVAIVPKDSDYGRKRQIDQSSCNKDYSCIKGFCPSFVSVHGGKLRKPKIATQDAPEGRNNPFSDLPDPIIPELTKEQSILITGVGGTGVVTVGALLAMAAHLEDKGCTTMDQTGLAQKGGSVTSHIRLAPKPEDIHTVRINAGGADVIIGADILTSADSDPLSKIRPNHTKTFLNIHETPSGDFTQNKNWSGKTKLLIKRIEKHLEKPENLYAMDATTLANGIMGNSIATNLFMLGYAFQKGTIPLSEASIMKAIELNAVAVDMNKDSFLWGRRAAYKLDKVQKIAHIATHKHPRASFRNPSTSVDEIIERRSLTLINYQNQRYANKYKKFVEKIRKAEKKLGTDSEALTEAIARNYYKLLAYKDEYDVARLYTDGSFTNHLDNVFEGDYKLSYHLAPPLFAKRDPETGHLIKKEFGKSIITLFKIMAKFKFLRGTIFDIFGYTEERKTERKLIKDYEILINNLLKKLDNENLKAATNLASLPDEIRGFGHVKEANIKAAKIKEAELLEDFYNPEQASPNEEAA